MEIIKRIVKYCKTIFKKGEKTRKIVEFDEKNRKISKKLTKK